MSGLAAPVCTYIGDTVDTGNGTTYTFTNHAIGTAAPDRLVVVVAHVSEVTGGAGIGSPTIGGSAATIAVESDESSGPTSSAIFYLLVPSGTTATIEFTTADASTHGSVSVYTITGWDSVTPIATGHDEKTSTTAASAALSTNIGDIVIAGTAAYSNSPTTTWTGGVTENDDSAFGGEAGTYSSAHGTATAATTTPVATPSTAAARSFVAAAWR